MLISLQIASIAPLLALAYWCEDVIFLKIVLTIILLNYIILAITIRKMMKYRKIEYTVLASVEGGENEL